MNRMGTEKIKISVQQALPMIAEMIKLKYVTDKLEKSSGWIYNKMNHAKTSTSSKGFNKDDISKLNETITSIGEILLHKQIIPITDNEIDTQTKKEDIIRQLKEVSTIISMPFIYENKLGKDKTWYAKRTAKGSKYKFGENDILIMNITIREIGNKLLSLELI